jgi:CHRD domain
MLQRARTLLVATVTALVIVACGDDDGVQPASKIVTFKATMDAASERQDKVVVSPGTGTFTATLDTSTNVFTYDVTFSGLTANVTLGHIHGPATTAVSTGTTINFATLSGATFTTGVSAGAAHGTTTLSPTNQITPTINGDSLKKLLLAGLTYANIHTSAFPQGEIRGQITKQ